MSRIAKTNVAIVAVAVLLWLAVRATAGAVHDHLGPNGVAFETMVRNFTLKGGDKPTRLSPLLPVLAWAPYAVTRSVAAGFTIVNGIAVAVLAFGVCMLMDDRRAAGGWKLFAASTFAVALMFAKLSVFEPASPALVALAAVMLAIACAERNWIVAASAANVAAVMALPIGLLAPVCSCARAIRVRMSPLAASVLIVPSLLMWLFVQWWARGGTSGVVADFTPHAMFGGSTAWGQPVFLAYAAYVFATAAGGLSLIACCSSAAWRRTWYESPELLVLAAGALVYAIATPDNAALAFAFVGPLWVVLCANSTVATESPGGWLWMTVAAAVTFITQRPFVPVNAAASLTAMHPGNVVLAALVAVLFGLARGRRATIPANWSRSTIDTAASGRWPLLAYGYATFLGLIAAYFLFGMPIQLTDSFGNLLDLQDVSMWQLFMKQLQNGAYLRPLLHVQLKVVYELARGNYFPWFRSVQALQVIAALLMAVRLLRPVRLVDAVVLPCGLAILLGIHTFAGTITEAFPINTFLTVVLCCLGAANLAASRGGWWIDAIAALLVAFAILTLETGVLVWLILLVGYIVGYRGVSMRGVGIATMVLAAYFVARVVLLHGAPPGLGERATGFGFRVLQPSDVIARFGRNPIPFYASNIASAAVTVFFAEPRGAVWEFIRGISDGSVEPWTVVNVLTSTLTSGVLAWYVARRARSWMAFRFDDGDRLVILFLAILPVNALLCAVYVKDVIMSPAGVFYALAATVAIRDLVESTFTTVPSLVPTWTMIVLVAISTGWGWRLVGIHYNLRMRAADLRTEWAFEEDWEAANPGRITTPQAVALKRALMEDAMWRRPAPPRLQLRWTEHAFDKTQ